MERSCELEHIGEISFVESPILTEDRHVMDLMLGDSTFTLPGAKKTQGSRAREVQAAAERVNRKLNAVVDSMLYTEAAPTRHGRPGGLIDDDVDSAVRRGNDRSVVSALLF